MAKRKRKSGARGKSARAKQQVRRRLLASSATLFAGILLLLLAFVDGQAAWHTVHDLLFGIFGAGSFVLGPAVCYMAVLTAQDRPVLGSVGKLALGLVFLSGAAVVFSDIPAQGMTVAQMGVACYDNGVNAWFGGGSMGGLLGGTLLLLCGRPAANLIVVALAACASCYVFDVTPADVWQWLAGVAGGAKEKGLEVYADGRAAAQERRAARLAARAQAEAEAEAMEDEEDSGYLDDGDLPGPDPTLDPDAGQGFHIGMPAWLSHIFGHGRLPDENGSTQPPQRPETPLHSAAVSHPRAPFDIDLGPDPAAVSDGGSEPIEPIITGPGGTFGLNPLRSEPRPANHAPLYDQDKDEGTAAPAQPQQPVPPPDRPGCRRLNHPSQRPYASHPPALRLLNWGAVPTAGAAARELPPQPANAAGAGTPVKMKMLRIQAVLLRIPVLPLQQKLWLWHPDNRIRTYLPKTGAP